MARFLTRLIDAQGPWARPVGDFVHGIVHWLFHHMKTIHNFLNGTWLGHPIACRPDGRADRRVHGRDHPGRARPAVRGRRGARVRRAGDARGGGRRVRRLRGHRRPAAPARDGPFRCDDRRPDRLPVVAMLIRWGNPTDRSARHRDLDRRVPGRDRRRRTSAATWSTGSATWSTATPSGAGERSGTPSRRRRKSPRACRRRRSSGPRRSSSSAPARRSRRSTKRAPMPAGRCPRAQIVNGCIECPWHGSRFELATGHLKRGPAVYDQPRYEMRKTDAGAWEARRANPAT